MFAAFFVFEACFAFAACFVFALAFLLPSLPSSHLVPSLLLVEWISQRHALDRVDLVVNAAPLGALRVLAGQVAHHLG